MVTYVVTSDDVTNDPMYVSDEKMTIFILVVIIFLLGMFSVIGIIFNVINMIIFVKQAVRDSMTVGLLALAFTDFSIASLELTFSCSYLASVICPWSSVDLWALNNITLTWAIYAFYLTSCWITVIISLERCICVVAPFRVKQIFTRMRCVLMIFVVYVLNISAVLPVFFVEKMEWLPFSSPNTNGSHTFEPQIWIYTIAYPEATQKFDTIMDITVGLFLFLTPQLVIFVCSVWMTFALKISSTVRSRRNEAEDTCIKPNIKSSNLTRPEKRLIKMVLFVDFLQLVCNVPRITVLIYYHTVFPGLDMTVVKNFSTILFTCALTMNTISCSSNSLGYYFLNSVYRKMFRNLFQSLLVREK